MDLCLLCLSLCSGGYGYGILGHIWICVYCVYMCIVGVMVMGYSVIYRSVSIVSISVYWGLWLWDTRPDMDLCLLCIYVYSGGYGYGILGHI